MGDTLLTYAVATEPDPLRTSPPSGGLRLARRAVARDELRLAELTIEVTNGTTQLIQCQSISFDLPIGENAKDFLESAAGITTVAPEGWTLEASAGGLFIATPKTDANGEIGKSALTFVLSNLEVNRQPGTFQLLITEESGDPAEAHTLALPLTKFPPRLEALFPFEADPPVVSQGDGVTLFWDAADGGTYAIEYGDVKIMHPKDEPTRPLPARGSYRVDGLESNLTVFNLLATYPGKNRAVVVKRQVVVTVNPPPTKIKLFHGELRVADDGRQELTLTWDADAEYCTLTGDPRLMRPSLTDGSYKLQLDLRGRSGQTYELAAVRPRAGSDTASLAVDWQVKDTMRVPLKDLQNAIAVSPDGTRLYVAGDLNRANSIQVFDAQTLKPVGSPVSTEIRILRLVASPDGNLLYAAGEEEGRKTSYLHILDARTLLPNHGQKLMLPIVDVAVSPDGKTFHMNHGDRIRNVLAGTYYTIADSGPLPSWKYRFALSHDGARLFVMDFGSSLKFSIYDAKTLKPVGVDVPLDRDFSPHSMSDSPDGQRLHLMGYADIRTIDAHTFKLIGQHVRHSNGMSHAVSPDGMRLYLLKEMGITIMSALSVTGGRAPS